MDSFTIRFLCRGGGGGGVEGVGGGRRGVRGEWVVRFMCLG